MSRDLLVYVATVVGGPVLGKCAAIALAPSVIAATGAGILLTARIVYGMASQRVLPPFLGNVSLRFRTPVAATVISGVILIVTPGRVMPVLVPRVHPQPHQTRQYRK